MNRIGEIRDKNILFLQGPMGSFFKKLSIKFTKDGANTFKIGFNAGDSFFSTTHNYTPYRGLESEWHSFISNFLKEKKIDKIFLFGDCRFYQNIAINIAIDLKIDVFVFEEGYIRPHYITLEKFGVNDYSRISREADFFKNLTIKKIKKPKHAKQSKFKLIMSAVIYYLIANIFSFRYPNYRHHRGFSASREAFFGFRGLLGKFIYFFFEKKYLKKI